MAMNGTTLKAEIKNAVQSANPAYAVNIGDDMDWMWEAIASAVVSHIQANALVTVTVASVSGVTPGGSASGPGTGTGTIS